MKKKTFNPQGYSLNNPPFPPGYSSAAYYSSGRHAQSYPSREHKRHKRSKKHKHRRSSHSSKAEPHREPVLTTDNDSENEPQRQVIRKKLQKKKWIKK